jgi:hypothetical protein
LATLYQVVSYYEDDEKNPIAEVNQLIAIYLIQNVFDLDIVGRLFATCFK